MNKTIGMILILITVSGCFSKNDLFREIDDTCNRYGYKKGTEAHFECIRETHQKYGNPENTNNHNVNVEIKKPKGDL